MSKGYLADFTVLSHIRCCINNKGLNTVTPKFHLCVKELLKVIKVHVCFSEEVNEVMRRT